MRERRRRYERTPISTSCGARFVYDGKERTAFMVDLSPQGAGFLISMCEPFGLSEGDQLHFEIKTPIGDSSCSGTVKWVNLVTAGIRFGVEFDDLAPDDPLLTYADSPF